MNIVIEDYLRDVKLGYGWVTLEKIGDDIYYDDVLKDLTVTDIVKYALNNGWGLYDDPEEGWSITSNY